MGGLRGRSKQIPVLAKSDLSKHLGGLTVQIRLGKGISVGPASKGTRSSLSSPRRELKDQTCGYPQTSVSAVIAHAFWWSFPTEEGCLGAASMAKLKSNGVSRVDAT